jgi:hypothetical protein
VTEHLPSKLDGYLWEGKAVWIRREETDFLFHLQLRLLAA